MTELQVKAKKGSLKKFLATFLSVCLCMTTVHMNGAIAQAAGEIGTVALSKTSATVKAGESTEITATFTAKVDKPDDSGDKPDDSGDKPDDSGNQSKREATVEWSVEASGTGVTAVVKGGATNTSATVVVSAAETATGKATVTVTATVGEGTASAKCEVAVTNEGGDQPGGDNNSGDQPGGDNNSGDQPGGDNSGDQPGGDNSGDQPGGDNSGDVAVENVTIEGSASVEVNKTITLTAKVAPTNATNQTVTWSCKDNTVVSLTPNGKTVVVNGKKVGSTQVTAVVDGKSATKTITVTAAPTPTPVPDVKVTGVTLNKATISLVEGKTEKLVATVAPANAKVKDVTWTTSNNKAATVAADGTVKAVKAGKATITVTTKDGNKTAKCEVTVTKKKVAAKKVTLSASKNVYVVAGKSITIGAAVEPANTTDSLKFTTDSKGRKVVTLKADKKNNSVKVTTKKGKTGKATITAKAGKKSAKVTVNVVKKATNATKITLNKKTLKINTGASAALQAKLTPAKATTEVKWSVDKAGKKVVNIKNGIVTGKKAGVATITAKAGKKTAKCVVTVTKAGVKTKLKKANGTVKVKKTLKITLKGDSKDTIASCTTSNKKIATVKVDKKKKSATITGKKKGKATITVVTKKGAVLTFKATVKK
ncbi:MAG: hypothetical protein HFH42_11610 [Lachnospiraceae bacterium]|nr:hypothetical protein [Lachnospiraceae bacterium]